MLEAIISLALLPARAGAFNPKSDVHCLQWSLEVPSDSIREESVEGSPVGNDPQLCRFLTHGASSEAVPIDGTCTNKVPGCGAAIGTSSTHLSISTWVRREDPLSEPHCVPISFGDRWTAELSGLDNVSSKFRVLYATVHPECDVWWRKVSVDVIPPIPELSVSFGTSPQAHKLGLCRTFGVDPAVDGGRKIVGTLVQEGPDFGRCFFMRADGTTGVLDGGNFHTLQSRRLSSSCTDNELLRRELSAGLRENLQLYLSKQDRELLTEVTGHDFGAFEQDLLKLSSCDLKQVVSTARYVPHELNLRGLHVMRCLLAERMADARAHSRGFANNSDYLAWKHNGFVRKDMDALGDDGLHQLLQIVSTEITESIPLPPYSWVPRNVTFTQEPDPQNALHIDTFSSIVKIWIFDQNTTKNDGPLMFAPGSNRNTKAKLKWMHAYSLPPATEALVEPSFRLLGSKLAASIAAEYVQQVQERLIPMLPLPGVKRTLVIADTSGLHARGVGVPGRTRVSWRLQGDNDGGLKRLEPFRRVPLCGSELCAL